MKALDNITPKDFVALTFDLERKVFQAVGPVGSDAATMKNVVAGNKGAGEQRYTWSMVRGPRLLGAIVRKAGSEFGGVKFVKDVFSDKLEFLDPLTFKPIEAPTASTANESAGNESDSMLADDPSTDMADEVSQVVTRSSSTSGAT
ncbi:hypothetical protein [Lichenibacterium dinghuense]|uniref:hypothetical protein n=1 Tax=Lichenibacterium dinghuense TaxID=2895977 RepID=UPI001F43CE9E|nr:hypothetical protein [Lichenibacterium sp. 6Y81]